MLSLYDFVATVARSGLIPAPELEEVLSALEASGVGAEDDPAALMAQALTARGSLTPYQARKLLAGVTKGYFVGGNRVLRPLGEGGSSLVFLATRPADGQPVAIKVLPPLKAAEEAQTLARFRREMELSRRVHHPSVARTLDVGTEDGVHFMVMEYVAGRSLFQAVKTRGPLPVAEAAKFFTKVCEGLEAAHAAGLIHRDIKPTNLMMTPDGGAKILDLGLARALGEDSLSHPEGGLVGTLDYISPEQIDNPSEADRRSDLYSMGCALYFALAGRAPFEGGDLVNKIYRHRFEAPEPLEVVNPEVSLPLAVIVRKLMAKHPDDRHQNARALRSDLSRWANPPPSESRDSPASAGPGPISDLVASDEPWEDDAPAAPSYPGLPPRTRAVAKAADDPRRLLLIIILLALIGSLAVIAIAMRI